jgi:hypothetical protein
MASCAPIGNRRWSWQRGCRTDELVVDAVRCHIDGLSYVREMLDRRYDDLESGRVQPIDGEEAFQRLMEKTEARRHGSA